MRGTTPCRDIIIEYENEESVNRIIELGIVKHKNLEFRPERFVEEEKEEKVFEAIYEITDIYKYPYYLFAINESFLVDFKNELVKINAQINSIDDDKIVLESLLKFKTEQDRDNCISNLQGLIEGFKNAYFDQYEIKNQTYDTFISLRDKLVEDCSKNDNITLVFRNDISNFFLRVEGKRDSIESIKQHNFEIQSMEF